MMTIGRMLRRCGTIMSVWAALTCAISQLVSQKNDVMKLHAVFDHIWKVFTEQKHQRVNVNAYFLRTGFCLEEQLAPRKRWEVIGIAVL